MGKISAQTAMAASEVSGDDYFTIVDASLVAGSPGLANKKITVDAAKAAFGSLVVGTVDPTTEGVDGQYYYNIDSGDNFGPKSAGSWGASISNLRGESWFGTRQTVSIVTGVVAVDYSLGRLIDVPFTSSISQFTFTNWPADGTAGSLTYRLSLSTVTNVTAAFASMGTDVRAEGGVAPSIPSEQTSTLIVTMYSADNRGTVDLFIGASDMRSI